MSFAPAGITDDAEIRTASSLVDYVFKRLALTYLSFDDRLELGLASIDDMPDEQTSLLGEGDLTLAEQPAALPVAAAVATPTVSMPVPEAPKVETRKPLAVKKDDTAPMCYQTQRAGSCYVCTACGSTTGCS
jgi:ribonucleoside-diphosphate reductase alpha chain